MNEKIKNIFIKLLNTELINFYKRKHDKRGLHSIKYETKYILNIILDKFITGVSWRHIKYFKSNSLNVNYNVVYYMYQKLVNNNLIKNAYNNLLKTFAIKIDNTCAYIDTTYIVNKYGYNTFTKYNNYVMTKHKTCKLSIISSKNGIPLNVAINNSLEHDIKMVINTIPKNSLFNKLYGDKGYIGKNINIELKNKHNIEIITPPKKNQKNVILTDSDKKAFKNRYVIEHINNFIKQNKQIQTRYIKNNDMFISYIYLAFMKRALEIFLR